MFWDELFNTWWGILVLCSVGLIVCIFLSAIFYRIFFKRFYDILLSGIAMILLSPVLLIVSIFVAIKLGRPVVFCQERPGKNRKIFKLHKFRTMTEAKNEEGNLLPDEIRLTKAGKFLRSTSLDELPELWDIFRGKMSIVGPRPLLVQYLPLYNEFQNRRHKVRPGLTGLAQINGRNNTTWVARFKSDVRYVEFYSFFGDIRIVFSTVLKVFKREGVSQQGEATMEYFLGNERNKEEDQV